MRSWSLALGLALVLAPEPAGQARSADGEALVASTPVEIFERSLRHSRGLRVQMSGRARDRVDAFGAQLVGTRWVGEFGLGEFILDTMHTGEKVLMFTLDSWHLPFLPLDAPERWLIGTGVYTTNGTASVIFTRNADGSPATMSWLDEYEFKIVDPDAYALTPEGVDVAINALNQTLDHLWLERSSVKRAQSALLARGLAYREIDTIQEFVTRLASDLALVLQEDGASARFVPLAQPVTRWDDEPVAEDDERAEDLAARRAAAEEFDGGLGIVRIADEGIGVLQVNAFLPGELVADIYAAAFEQIATSHALVIDLRQASGGHPTGARQLASHFVNEGTPLVTIEVPARDEIELAVAAAVPAVSAYRKPVFILTSTETMGAAEEFAATLQARAIATVIGETTAGVGNLTRRAMITPHIEVTIPSERTTVLASGESWHGRGVKPDITAGPADSGAVAWRMATGREDKDR